MTTYNLSIRGDETDTMIETKIIAHDMLDAKTRAIRMIACIVSVMPDNDVPAINEMMPPVSSQTEYVARVDNDFIFDVTITREG